MELTQDEKLKAILCMIDNDGSRLHNLFAAYDHRAIWQGINDGSPISITMMQDPFTDEWHKFEVYCVDDRPHNKLVIDSIFQDLAYQEYLKKKKDFSKQPRNNKGQFIKR